MIEEILKALKDYILFIYPGFLSLYIYDYLEGKKVDETKLLILKSIVLSYIYVCVVRAPFDFDVDSPETIPLLAHLILLVLSVGLPIVLCSLLRWEKLNKVRKFLHISTRQSSNPIEIALTMEKCPWVCVYMDKYGVMYEGEIRNYVKDPDRSKYIMLSGYKVSKLPVDNVADSENVYKQVYPPVDSTKNITVRNNEWVILYLQHITRIEVFYNNNH